MKTKFCIASSLLLLTTSIAFADVPPAPPAGAPVPADQPAAPAKIVDQGGSLQYQASGQANGPTAPQMSAQQPSPGANPGMSPVTQPNQAPQGQAPQGQAPQGQAPQGQAPQGQMPQGQMPNNPTPPGPPGQQ